MKTWGGQLRACHDSFSSRVLDLIPCLLLVIGGGCAWESYTKAIPESSKLVSFQICEDVNVQYALEFDPAGTSLRRIAAKIDQPSFGYRNLTFAASTAIRLDAQCNFILWLSGRDFIAQSYESPCKSIVAANQGQHPSQHSIVIKISKTSPGEFSNVIISTWTFFAGQAAI